MTVWACVVPRLEGLRGSAELPATGVLGVQKERMLQHAACSVSCSCEIRHLASGFHGTDQHTMSSNLSLTHTHTHHVRNPPTAYFTLRQPVLCLVPSTSLNVSAIRGTHMSSD